MCEQILLMSTYDHRSVKAGHPVRNHEVSVVFVVPGTKILEKGVVIAGTWIHVTCKSHDPVNDLPDDLVTEIDGYPGLHTLRT